MVENAILSFCKKRKYQKLRNVSLLCLATLNITACDYVSKKFYPDFRRSTEKTHVEKPAFARKNISIEKVRDIASTSKDDNIFTASHVATPNKDILSEDLAEEKNLFATAAKNEEERFQRIENKIQNIADTLSRMSPAITRLMDVDSELDALTFQLEELINKGQMNALAQDNNNTMSREVSAQPQHARSPLIQEAMSQPQPTPNALRDIAPAAGNPAQAMTVSNDLIHKIRLADHSDKTRIVFETEEKLDYSVKIDSENKIMTIHFPEGQLPSDPASRARFSNLIQDIAQHKIRDGSNFSFQLSQAPRTSKDFRMPPDEDVSRQRIVIDLIH